MKRKIIFSCILALSGIIIQARELSKMQSYDFHNARLEYMDSLNTVNDTLKSIYRDSVRLAENAISLSEYCYSPSVVAREKFPREDFFLNYPMPDKAWHLATDDSGFSATVFRTGADTSAFALNKSDSLNLFSVICAQERYFCSKDLFGMGGYDIYVQRRSLHTGKWSEPQNLGFPFNSPFDDLLFFNTADGRHSIFASNRDCSPDSVYVYVVEFEPVPIRKPVSGPEELRKIAALVPIKEVKTGSEVSVQEDSNTKLYRSCLEKVASCRKAVESKSNELETLRGNYADATSSQRQALAAKLLEGERALNAARQNLAKASEELAALEMKFSKEGVNIDQSSVSDIGQKEKPAPKTGADFKFVRRSPGESLRLIWR